MEPQPKSAESASVRFFLSYIHPYITPARYSDTVIQAGRVYVGLWDGWAEV